MLDSGIGENVNVVIQIYAYDEESDDWYPIDE